MRLFFEQENPFKEEVAKIIKGWTVEVTLIDGHTDFLGNKTFRCLYHSHDADHLNFDIFDPKTGVSRKGVISTGFGWELIEEIRLIGLGRLTVPQVVNPKNA